MTAATVPTAWLAGEAAAGVRGGAALLVAWAASAVPRVPAAVRCWAWRAAFAVAVVAFAWTTPVDVAVLRRPADRAAAEDVSTSVMVDVAGPGPTRPGSAATSRTVHWPAVAFAVWAAVAAGIVGRTVVAGWRVRHLRAGRAVDVPALAEMCRTAGVRWPPAVVARADVRSPLLVGLWRPTVVLPDPPPADLRLVVAHELAHLRRRDLLWNWLPMGALVLLPWHPLVWIGRRRWRLAVESAADADAVSATAVDPAAYGRLIVSVATRPWPASSSLPAVAVAAESAWLLKRRLAAMAHVTRWTRRRLATAGLLVGTGAVAAAVPWRAVAQQPATTPPATAPALPAATAVDDGGYDVQALGEAYAPTGVLRAPATAAVVRVAATVGQTVKAGDVLVQLDDTNAQADVAQTQAALNYEATQLAYKQESRRANSVAQSEVDLAAAQVELAKARLTQARHAVQLLRLTAPYDATVAACDVSAGESVAAGQAVVTVVRAGRPLVRLSVPAESAGRVRPGLPVRVTPTGGGPAARSFAGEVMTVSPVADPATQMVQVTAHLAEDVPGLLPGMTVSARVHVPR